MIKKTFYILLLLAAIAAVTLAAIYRHNTRSLLLESLTKDKSAEVEVVDVEAPTTPCDTLVTDTLTVQY